MRRHSQTCAKRVDRIPPGKFKRGPKSTTCDRCAQRKIACNREHPCAGCRDSARSCRYSQRPREPLRKVPKVADYSDATTTRAPSGSMDTPFLLTFADPTSGFSDLGQFTNSRSAGESETTPDLEQMSLAGSAMPGWWTTNDLSVLFGLPSQMMDPESCILPDPSLSGLLSLPEDPLQHRINEALEELGQCERTTWAERHHDCAATGITDVARLAISPHSLCVAVDAYFRYVHQSLPLIHQPSFDLYTVSTPLLLVVYIAGSKVLPPTRRSGPSSSFLNLVECYLFEGKIMTNIARGGPAIIEIAQSTVEILQAAILMVQIQSVVETSEKQHHLRNTLLPIILSAIRTLSLPQIKNTWSLEAVARDEEASWQWFLRMEALVRITTMAFLVDCYFAMFYRTPPRFTLQEMTGSLPCADELFAIDNAPSWSHQLRRMGEPTPVSLATVVDCLLQPSGSGRSLHDFGSVNIRGLYVTISGLHAVIVTARATLTLRALAPTVAAALDQWRELWDNLMECTTDQQLENHGFMKFGLELWWLAEVMLDEGSQPIPINQIDTWSRKHIHRALSELHRKAVPPRRRTGDPGL
ncbi:hypothetical protein BDV25DRAFT_143559 [Aspergillus avenaceus]|uniref:Zn(2)-C6 fungal-type domain-containing protein n=1 Tax=Aspergillus avenaceus TaxID=36643 RepID=A0A5N6TJV1_ASPAV|nr:hypothetical protein BDV25DRAFT_143559 [Aspergillus avenaceus]